MSYNQFFPCTSISDGDGSLKSIDVEPLIDGDAAFVVDSGLAYIYRLNTTHGGAGDDFNVVVPYGSPGDKRWILCNKPYVHPNHSGDVASTGDGTTTIANKAVTLAKMADIDSGRILGRVSVGSGVTESLTASEVRALLKVAENANNYSLPTASAGTLGGVKVGTRLTITDGVLSADLQDAGGPASVTMGDLTDVDLTGLANENILKYDSTNTKWIPSALPGSGFTAASGAEVDAGTDNTKGVTPKAIHDSKMRIWRKLTDWTRLASGYLGFQSKPPVTPGESIRIIYSDGVAYTTVYEIQEPDGEGYWVIFELFDGAKEGVLSVEYGGGDISQIAIPINGLYAAKSETHLLQNYLKSPLLWLKKESYITAVYFKNEKKETGTSEYPSVNVTVAGNGLAGDPGYCITSTAWVRGTVTRTNNYKVECRDQIDISVTRGTDGDAEDLTVLITLLTP